MKKILAAIGIALAGLAAYLCLWPVPITPQSWDAPTAPGYTGPFAANNKLANLKMIPLGAEEGPEHLVVAKDGKLYATLASGGRDNGAPGERPYHPGYYAAFVLDPDGNNIEAVFHGEAQRSAPSVTVTF